MPVDEPIPGQLDLEAEIARSKYLELVARSYVFAPVLVTPLRIPPAPPLHTDDDPSSSLRQ